MNIIEKLPASMAIRDKERNRELALEILENHDQAAVHEAFENLTHENELIRSDCLSVLIEVGLIKPEMISDGVVTFLHLLDDPHTRIVENALAALATIAHIDCAEIFVHHEKIIGLIEQGSQEMVFNGIMLLGRMAECGAPYERALTPYLIDYIGRCLPHEVTHLVESTMYITSPDYHKAMIATLQERYHQFNISHKKKADQLLKQLARLI